MECFNELTVVSIHVLQLKLVVTLKAAEEANRTPSSHDHMDSWR